ncbi:serine hydrolase [Nocardiopsis sp. MG754419]|uniref:serine hydrolase domain-containing protein n=1 Tax=Nocardiopsis sp. MG754419 TaxID=2259865 RepID=UPI001BA4D17B|nr:serine hydrolase domain-containing protein [Nocardiopsis sp. MG754419]MBR8743578.1 hypothetical protein [Nocardiopsis sp. MG754419]
MRPHPRTFTACLAAGLALAPLLIAAPAAHAASPEQTPAAPPSPEAVQEFVDTRVAELLDEHGAPGVALTVVADGEELTSAAHGVADLAEGTPLDAREHGFPTASVAKSFTAVAVLQLAEQGDLDLHEDVNTYLPEEMRLPDTHPGEPVTLHHLLTHTAGFDERTEFEDPADVEGRRDLEEFLRDVTPERIFAPGRYPAYSNYGSGLAGFVVQEVSGAPFEEYVERNVFAPLGMNRSEFGQLHELEDHHVLATSHGVDGAPLAQDHLPLVPAGGAVTTTGDMGRFMLALLNGGALDGERVLDDASVESMLGRRFEHHPDATSLGYGTYEWRAGAQPGIGHGGDLDGLHTGYLLLPESDTGVFVAVNGDDTDPEAADSPLHDLRFTVLNAFADTFAPVERPSAEADPGADLDAYTGTYITTRRPAEGKLRLLTLFDNLTVRDAGDGSLSTSGLMASDERLLPAGDHVFVGEDSGERLFFDVENGRADALYLDANPTNAYDRTAPLAGPALHLIAATAALALLLTGVLRFRRPVGAAQVVAAVSGSLTSIACLVGTGLVAYALMDMGRMRAWLLSDSVTLTLPFALAVPLLSVTLVMGVRAWREGWWGPVRRVHYSLIPLAAAVVVAVAFHYHLVWPLG